MENMRGWFGRGGLSFSSHPCLHSFSSATSLPRKAHHQLLFPGGPQPRPRTALSHERPSPGISHWRWSGPTQCRRWCPWQNSLDPSALDAVTQAIFLLHLAPPRHPASPPRPLCPAHPSPPAPTPAALQRVLFGKSSAVENLRDSSTQCYWEKVVPSVCFS